MRGTGYGLRTGDRIPDIATSGQPSFACSLSRKLSHKPCDIDQAPGFDGAPGADAPDTESLDPNLAAGRFDSRKRSLVLPFGYPMIDNQVVFGSRMNAADLLIECRAQGLNGIFEAVTSGPLARKS